MSEDLKSSYQDIRVDVVEAEAQEGEITATAVAGHSNGRELGREQIAWVIVCSFMGSFAGVAACLWAFS